MLYYKYTLTVYDKNVDRRNEHLATQVGDYKHCI